MLELTEEDALQRLRAQDPAALSWLIGRYNRYVASIVCAVLGARCRPQDAEELTADVFYSVFRRAEAISPGKLQAYLGAAARNRAKDFLRKQARVRAAIEAMTPVDREIFLRYYYYLQPAPEIAQAMGLTHGAVRTRLSRGRAALKKTLLQEDAVWT